MVDVRVGEDLIALGLALVQQLDGPLTTVARGLDRTLVVTDPGGLDRAACGFGLIAELLGEDRRREHRACQLGDAILDELRPIRITRDHVVDLGRRLIDAQRAVPARGTSLHPREHRASSGLGGAEVEVGCANRIGHVERT